MYSFCDMLYISTNIGTEMDADFQNPENYVRLWKWLIDVARAKDARDLVQSQLTTDASNLNRSRVEAALARAQNRIKVADNS